jgi:predicted ferric reductase
MPFLFVTFIGLLIVTVTSLDFFRRRFYKWFYRIHHFNWIYLIIAVIHAWTLWNYLLIGGVLYIVDKIVRLHKSIHPFRVTSIQQTDDGGHTCLVLAPLDKEFLYSAGQFGWINIPAIDPYSWHPFSIVPRRDGQIQFVIKSNGATTWTGDLLAFSSSSSSVTSFLHSRGSYLPFASINSVDGDEKRPLVEESRPSRIVGSDLRVYLDGPYGHLSISPYDYEHVILIAGGVGITPMASLFIDLGVKRPSKLVSCTLYWTVRTPEIFSTFEKEFSEIVASNPNVMNVTYIVTQSKVKVSVGNSEVRSGRLNVADELTKVTCDPKELGVFVCGPQVLVESTELASRMLECDVHSEIFEF